MRSEGFGSASLPCQGYLPWAVVRLDEGVRCAWEATQQCVGCPCLGPFGPSQSALATYKHKRVPVAAALAKCLSLLLDVKQVVTALFRRDRARCCITPHP